MKSPIHKDEKYDFAVVGSGFSGLILASYLSQKSQNVALVEASENFGGVNRPISTPAGFINNGLRGIPNTDSSQKALEFLGEIIGASVKGATTDHSPVTFENGGLKPFVGFGETPPDFYEELLYFASQTQIQPQFEIHQWPKLLFEKFKGDFFSKSYVTRFHVSEEGHQITHMTLNGNEQKQIRAQKFIFCGTLMDLAVLLPNTAFSARTRNKLKKDSYWTTLCLDLVHSGEITDSQAAHVLNGTTQDEIGPCVGRFMPSIEIENTSGDSAKKMQVSQWVTFLDEGATTESEVVALALKKIKRQIKRAYPEALEKLELERIFVAQNTSGDGNLKLSKDGTLPGLSNFYIGCGASCVGDQNLVASLNQAKLIVESLSFEPIESASSQPELLF